MMLWPRVSVCEIELQVDKTEGKGGDAGECRPPFEEIEGLPGGRGEGAGEERAPAWTRETESYALLTIPSLYGPQNAFPQKKALLSERKRQAADSGGRRPSQTYAEVN